MSEPSAPIAAPRSYRKRPVVVTAAQFTGEVGERGWFSVICRLPHVADFMDSPMGPHIHSLEGPLHVTVGDWIVRGIKGEFYAVKPDIFEATYEPCSAIADRLS